METADRRDWLIDDDAKPPEASPLRSDRKPWQVLIADDDREVHMVTELALRDFEFDGRPLEFLHAYSGREAVEIIREHTDVAAILMDVVMESEHAGLDAVHSIRRQLGNRLCRIILRTGHPGQAPENEIISRYDIDDYREKTELSSKKLYTSIYVAIRSYRDARALERNRRGLEKVIGATTHLLGKRGIAEFSEGVLEQIAALLHLTDNAFVLRTHGFVSTDIDAQMVAAAAGRFAGAGSLQDIASIDPGVAQTVRNRLNNPGTTFGDGWFVHCIESPSARHMVLYLESDQPWSTVDRRVLELFSNNVSIAMDNLFLNEQLASTQREIVLMLGEAIEMRSLESGKHVQRVAEYAACLAELCGLDSMDVHNLRMAAPLHDVGKIAIEDVILNKPGRHTAEEAARMREHASIGAKLFEGHDLPVLDTARIVAAEHHENWDGSGYPLGKAGEDIHIFGRIVALADVYDALGSRRCYKDPWTAEDTINYVREQRGRKFDPRLVDLLIENIDRIVDIGERLADAQG